MVDPRVARFTLPLAAFSAMTLLVLATGAVLFARKIGLEPERVRDFYLGSEAAFTQPRSLAGLLEVAVPHLLAIPVTVFVTLHLVAFLGVARRRTFAVLAGITWACVAAAVGSGFAIRFAWPGLAPLKVLAFVGLEATLVSWLLLVVAAILPSHEPREGDLTGSAPAPRGASR